MLQPLTQYTRPGVMAINGVNHNNKSSNQNGSYDNDVDDTSDEEGGGGGGGEEESLPGRRDSKMGFEDREGYKVREENIPQIGQGHEGGQYIKRHRH